MGYTIDPTGKTITCHACRRTSHHPMDVQHRYCGWCHVFHDDRRRWREIKRAIEINLLNRLLHESAH